MTFILKRVNSYIPTCLSVSSSSFYSSITPWYPTITDENYEMTLACPTIRFANRIRLDTNKVNALPLLEKIDWLVEIEFTRRSVSDCDFHQFIEVPNEMLRIPLVDKIFSARYVRCGYIRSKYITEKAFSHPDVNFVFDIYYWMTIRQRRAGEESDPSYLYKTYNVLKRLFLANKRDDAWRLFDKIAPYISVQKREDAVDHLLDRFGDYVPNDEKKLVELNSKILDQVEESVNSGKYRTQIHALYAFHPTPMIIVEKYRILHPELSDRLDSIRNWAIPR